ncbi:succinylglutamate desuccinylase/aspartoacylase family protein [Solimonas marina]|uniref:Succinylglutamate desuccinylase n=1 Tax=Solimonas marina TaxID=2714601 RepID=A0A969W7R1_9GAMM|nr:succinylglutamate desuccinylase/aspartoacylase family protein [Solimonas marina]NKF22172.1 succinylglutamate desuccinylase [Solimonas marina]
MKRPTQAPLEFGGQTVAAGERRLIELPVGSLYTRTPVSLPVHIVRGCEPGPTMFVSAALHGDEINGVEIIRRLLLQPDMGQLRGTLLAVPIVNTLAFLHQSRYLPDRRDLNRSFPGSARGSLAARLARMFLTEIVGRSQYGVDLHTGALHRPNLPHIRADLQQPRMLALAQAFGVPLLLNSTPTPGTLRAYTTEQGIPVILYEAGEALRLDELAIRTGVRGVLSVMRALEMLPPVRRGAVQMPEPVVARSATWVRAPASGMLRTKVALGAQVLKGEALGVIGDPLGGDETPVLAASHGVVVGRTALPLVYEGDALFHLARFDAAETAAGVARNIATVRRMLKRGENARPRDT